MPDKDISALRSSLSQEQKATLEKRLRSALDKTSQPAMIGRRANRAEAIPLSFAQRRLWFLDQLQPDNPFYNLSAALRIHGHLKISALKKSLAELINRHEILRTTFDLIDAEPAQIIASSLLPELPIVDLQHLPEGQHEENVMHLAAQQAGQVFDLKRGPLLRVTLLRLGDEEFILLVTMHHIISDGWSTGIFIREIAALYESYSFDKPSLLPELPIQYADFSVWQRQRLQDGAFEDQSQYWRRQLDGAPALLEVLTNRPRPSVQSYRGAKHMFELSEQMTESLETFTRQQSVTLFMTLLAAFNILLSRYANQEDILIGVPVANRNRTELESLIGFFVNTLVIRTYLSGNPDFLELVGRVRKASLEAYAHQDLPFEKLIEEIHVERTLSHAPLCQIMFVLNNTPQEKFRLAGLTIEELEVETKTAKLDLILLMQRTERSLRGVIEYNEDLYEAETISRVAANFLVLLKSVLADPRQHLSELSILTEAERQQLLTDWSHTGRSCPPSLLVNDLFEQQVDQSPHKAAAFFNDHCWTFQALNDQADLLADVLGGLKR